MKLDGQSCPMCGALVVDAETHSRASGMKWHLRDDCPWAVESRRPDDGTQRGRSITASDPMQPGEGKRQQQEPKKKR